MILRNLFLLLLVSLVLSCNEKPKKDQQISKVPKVVKEPVKEYGFIAENYAIYRDTVRSGDTFGNILDSHGVPAGTVFQIIERVKDTFNPAKLVTGKPYAILKSKDTTDTAQGQQS